MRKNLGNADKMIRILIAAVAALLFFTNIVTGTLGIIVLVGGGILLATSLINFCPLYAILGINTCPRKA
jgi:hypothetical protein